MPTLNAFMRSDFGTDNVAGYLAGGTPKTFKYFRSSRDALPAFVNALQAAGNSTKVYTTYDTAPWPKHVVQNVKGLASLQASSGDGALEITPVEQVVRKWPRQVVSARGGSAPLDSGLHAAAVAVRDGVAAAKAGTRDRGLQRALRYYMLAAYSLVDISAAESFAGLKNYVGTLLVGDDGRILAAGINTGSFRHAEVSTLISYFRNNPLATALPAKSILFSTLTPCRQCTGYLETVKAADTVIYFGQRDTGNDGKVGERISAQLSKQTGGLSGRSKTAFTDVPKEIEDPESDTPIVVLSSTGSIHKVQIDHGLATCMGSDSIALQVGKAKDSRHILASASDALIHKVGKDRAADDAEAAVKRAVLHHVCGWLMGTSVSA